jgi:hypothetical protein
MISNIVRQIVKYLRQKSLSFRISLSTLLNRIGFKTIYQHHYYKIDKKNYGFYKIPGFTSPNERKYLYNHIKRNFWRKSTIVELGCAFGSLSVPVLQALHEKKTTIDKLHVFDLFQYHESFGDVLTGCKFQDEIKSGECFEFIFNHYTQKYSDLLVVNKGDLSECKNFSESIDLLIIDAMKSESLAFDITKTFYPALSKDSVVFHQDFCHYHEPWIHIIQYKYKDFFTPLCHIEDTSTYLFRCKKVFHENDIEDLNIMDMPNDLVASAFDYSLSLVQDQPGNQNIEACKIFCFMLKHEFETARELIDYIVGNTVHIEDGNLRFVIKIAESITDRENEIIDHYEKNKINLLDDLNFITSITYSS